MPRIAKRWTTATGGVTLLATITINMLSASSPNGLADAFTALSPSFLTKQASTSSSIMKRMNIITMPSSSSTQLQMAKSKGFAKNQPKPKKESSTDDNDNNEQQVQSTVSDSIQSTSPPSEPSPLSGGSEALARLRRQEAEKRNEELRAIREIRSVDEFVREDPNAAVIPEAVAMRMGKRMLPFVGIPLFGGMAAFVAFWYFATYQNMEFQPALVAFSTIALLAVGLVGITYSVMSASWDPDVEGSTMGIDEFKTNLDNIKDGLKRSRENLILREKMAGLPEEEIQSAIRELDKRDERLRREKMDLKEKMKEELE